MIQNPFMQIALEEAEKALNAQEVPVGAIIVNRETKQIITKSHNMVEDRKIPIYHAEILVLIDASQKLNSKYLQNCDLYVTLEPCHLCAAAISMFRVGRLFYGASDPKGGAISSVLNFFNSANCLFKPEIYSDIHADKSAKLMGDFFHSLRSHN